MKVYVKGALQALVVEETYGGNRDRDRDKEDLMEPLKEDLVRLTDLLEMDPKHLTETHDESHQKK
jgi:hypothetical protein